MSHEKSMSERLPEFLFSSIHQAMGAASMAWIPIPSTEVFDGTRAGYIALELCRAIADWHEQAIATLTAERAAAQEHYRLQRDAHIEALDWRDEEIGKLRAERDALRTALEETPPLSVWVGCQYGLQPDVDAITDWMRLKIEALGGKS